MFETMMTSASISPRRFTNIDALTISDHGYLNPEDKCYFIGEYTAGKGFDFSETNSLILNFKKGVDRHSNSNEWKYKEHAIQEIAGIFRYALPPHLFDEEFTFVPIPPSKARTDPLYDDRLSQMLRAISSKPPLDVRDLIVQIKSTKAAHDRDDRPNPDQIKELYKINDDLMDPPPKRIAVVDDVLTTGAHFKASQSLLSHRFSDVSIIGLFVARRVFNVINDFKEIWAKTQSR